MPTTPHITGVDMSEEMLSIAPSLPLNSSTAQQLNFLHGDIRTFRMDKKFDVAISLYRKDIREGFAG